MLSAFGTSLFDSRLSFRTYKWSRITERNIAETIQITGLNHCVRWSLLLLQSKICANLHKLGKEQVQFIACHWDVVIVWWRSYWSVVHLISCYSWQMPLSCRFRAVWQCIWWLSTATIWIGTEFGFGHVWESFTLFLYCSSQWHSC